MICICIAEFVKTYFPDVAQIISAVLRAILGNRQDYGFSEDDYRFSEPKKVNEQYTGFVGKDGTSVRGKQKKSVVRKADEKAAEQLRRLGSARKAKYRHVSEAFLRR